MSTAVIFLTALLQIVEGSQNACVPGSSFVMNDRFCVCDKNGAWSEPHCYANNRSCKQGEIVQRGCSLCTCNNGQFYCSDAGCNETQITQKEYNVITPKCVPYMTYFVDCRICTCPGSGNTIQATCFPDPSCAHRTSTTPEFILSRNMCIPGVMYLFPCLYCVCSVYGKFSAPNCYETCTIHQAQCQPKTFYKNDCNVCYCPANGIKDNKICSTTDCAELTTMESLRQQKHIKCSPHSFTEPKCLYCDCSSSGKVNDNACLNLECIDTNGLDYNADKGSCRPGSMVLLCSECFCLESGTTNNAYCSKTCTYDSKLEVLNEVIKDSIDNGNLLDKNKLRNVLGKNCRPETVFLRKDKYCLCPNDSRVNRSLCSSINVEQYSFLNKMQNHIEQPKRMKIEFGLPCKSGTFVEFDCNSCFCSDGSIDAKWCTYDDCGAKIQSKAKKHQFFNFGILAPSMKIPAAEPDGLCNPGSITKIECNFCICPDSGLLSERTCTRNNCTTTDQPINQDFSCEPMRYYEVDCNVCLCPKDGQKNVDKCTKNVCQKSFLRTARTGSRACIPGELFSNECNVCVCPLNGNQDDKACTDHNCPDSDANLLIFKRSPEQTSLEERKLDFCFTGEQFIEDCKFCVCPESGLKAHSTCNSMLCDDEQRRLKHRGLGSQNHQNPFLGRSFPLGDDQCGTFFEGQVIDRLECRPGLIYTTGCKQCICPTDNEERYCRTIPSVYCGNLPQADPEPHTHDSYPCFTPGKLADPCFICECEDQGASRTVVREHCFRSESAACIGATPAFLNITSLL